MTAIKWVEPMTPEESEAYENLSESQKTLLARKAIEAMLHVGETAETLVGDVGQLMAADQAGDKAAMHTKQLLSEYLQTYLPDEMPNDFEWESGRAARELGVGEESEAIGMGARLLLYPLSDLTRPDFDEAITKTLNQSLFRIIAHAIVLADATHLLRAWQKSTQPNEVTAKKRTPRELAHPLQKSELAQIPNDPASVLFGEVIARLGSWKTNENGCFKYAQKGKSIVSFHLDEEMPDAFSEQLLQTLDARFAAMKGDLVADVADILFWHWYANERPAYAEITLSQILEYRKKIKPGPDTIKEHWQAMRDVRAIKLRGGGVESESLFHISAAQFTEENSTNLKTVYRYHPGYFLSEAIQRDAFYIAYFARNVWQLDYYRDADAKRLARVLRAEWRRNAASYLPPSHPLAETPRYRTWKALLSDAGIDYESGRAESNPTKFIKAIESELEKLYSKAEFIRECAPVCYHPDDREKRENLPRYNPLKTWLSLHTHIAPAADITDLLAQTTTRQLAQKAQLKALAESKKSAPRRRKKAK